MYKRKLAIVAILAATVLLLVTTSSLAIGSELAVKTRATDKIKSSNGRNICSVANTSTTTATLDTSTHKDSKNLSPGLCGPSLALYLVDFHILRCNAGENVTIMI